MEPERSWKGIIQGRKVTRTKKWECDRAGASENIQIARKAYERPEKEVVSSRSVYFDRL